MNPESCTCPRWPTVTSHECPRHGDTALFDALAARGTVRLALTPDRMRLEDEGVPQEYLRDRWR